MKLNQKLKDRLHHKYGSWAIVTGASSGIGKELATMLASAGINVVLVARSEKKLETLSALLKATFLVETLVIATDLTTAHGNELVKERCKSLSVGLLIANAGFGTSGTFIDNPIKDELAMVHLNCISLLMLTHHFANRFKVQEKGGIILLGSLVGFQGAPYAANYGATKAYVQSLAEALAVELKPYRIDVLSAAPGPVETGFADRAAMKMDNAQKADKIAKSILSSLGQRTTVFPGRLSKFLGYSLKMLPRSGKVKVMTLVMKKMTKHHDSKKRV
ncbi:MAG: SDR family NAD(P)-dependent oxidoreductase [Cyclobacteriaceae bacterium]|nr:SDR family NAD(P)-dependent oxidoreductase [Cyclobacteriaceae bacterium HetDA_MAG_MS6]